MIYPILRHQVHLSRFGKIWPDLIANETLYQLSYTPRSLTAKDSASPTMAFTKSVATANSAAPKTALLVVAATVDEFYGGLDQIGDSTNKKRVAVMKMQFLLVGIVAGGLFASVPGAVAHGGSGGGGGSWGGGGHGGGSWGGRGGGSWGGQGGGYGRGSWGGYARG